MTRTVQHGMLGLDDDVRRSLLDAAFFEGYHGFRQGKRGVCARERKVRGTRANALPDNEKGGSIMQIAKFWSLTVMTMLAFAAAGYWAGVIYS